MDGGSTDDSADIIKKHEKHLAYWVSAKDNGQAAAINSGFQQSTGDVLLWLNSDDMLMPNALNFIAEKVLKEGDNLFFGECIHFRKQRGGTLDAWGSDVGNESKKIDLSVFDYIIQPSSFWTRKIWEQAGSLNESLHYGFDWEWFLRVRRSGTKLLYADKILSLYRYHDGHKSKAGGTARQKELLQLYGEFGTEMAPLYSLLMEDQARPRSLKYRIIRKAWSLLKKQHDYADLLAAAYPERYRKFSTGDIRLLVRML